MNGGLLKRPAPVPPASSGTNAFVCSVQVEDYDEIHQLIMEQGGQVALPKFAIPGRCWQGYFIDTDNNVFGIFEVDENAK
jgi:predicted enzyme related to lactoylglutathione lyase